MTEWREVKLADLGSFSSGKAIKPGQDGKYRAFGSNGVIGWSTEARHQSGIIIGRVGAYCGSVAVSREPFWASDNTIVVEPGNESDLDYLYYLLRGADLNRHAGGSAQPLVTQTTLKSLVFRIPGKEVRRRIGLQLRLFDNLIENNRRRIKLLESMARAIYREWFVHFRFPGHEDVPMVDSDLGPMPGSWETVTLGEAGRWISGGTPRTSVPEYWGGHLPWITSGTLTSMLLDRSDRTLTKTGAANGTRLVNRDALLFVVRGMSLVKEFRVGIAEKRMAFGQDVKALVASDCVEPLYLAFSVITRDAEIQRMVELAGHGTGKLSTDRLRAIRIPLPPMTVQRAFAEAVSPLRELMAALRNSTDELIGMRDLLLPKLVSGEIDVSGLDLDNVIDKDVVISDSEAVA